PRRLQIEFSQVVQGLMDDSGKELVASDIWNIFQREYGIGDFARARVAHPVFTGETLRLSAVVQIGGRQFSVDGVGSGPIDAFVDALNRHLGGSPVRVLDYHEHSIGSGADAEAVAYLELRIGDELTLFGVGLDASI